jgi:hypothetical protein
VLERATSVDVSTRCAGSVVVKTESTGGCKASSAVEQSTTVRRREMEDVCTCSTGSVVKRPSLPFDTNRPGRRKPYQDWLLEQLGTVEPPTPVRVLGLPSRKTGVADTARSERTMCWLPGSTPCTSYGWN